MKKLPENLYTAAGCRELDRIAIEERGIPGVELMQRAGQSVFSVLQQIWPKPKHIAVVCGSGNNGGDGYVIARLAAEVGYSVKVFATAQAKTDDAAAMQARMEQAGLSVSAASELNLSDTNLVVDALFGTGLTRAPSGQYANIIHQINRSRIPVLSVDIPSGLDSDNGHVPGKVIRADATVTFIGMKIGLLTGAGREYAGDIYFDDLAVPPTVYDRVSPSAQRITPSQLQVPVRPRNAHKGDSGHVLAIGGDHGMPGAVRMCAESAVRVGAGLVSAATRAENIPVILTRQAEIMAHAVATAVDLESLLPRADVIAIGPGLGQSLWSREMLAVVLRTHQLKIIDADGLNLLAEQPVQRDDWILTPHPGEAARLLGMNSADIQADRPAAVQAIAERYGGVCVLKGSGSLIGAQGELLRLCDRGNPGMASGGMGDILTGVIAGLLAQHLTPLDAATLGVWLHATAGDDEARVNGMIGMSATELLPWLRKELNQLCQ